MLCVEKNTKNKYKRLFVCVLWRNEKKWRKILSINYFDSSAFVEEISLFFFHLPGWTISIDRVFLLIWEPSSQKKVCHEIYLHNSNVIKESLKYNEIVKAYFSESITVNSNWIISFSSSKEFNLCFDLSMIDIFNIQETSKKFHISSEKK